MLPNCILNLLFQFQQTLIAEIASQTRKPTTAKNVEELKATLATVAESSPTQKTVLLHLSVASADEEANVPAKDVDKVEYFIENISSVIVLLVQAFSFENTDEKLCVKFEILTSTS